MRRRFRSGLIGQTCILANSHRAEIMKVGYCWRRLPHVLLRDLDRDPEPRVDGIMPANAIWLDGYTRCAPFMEDT